jgi:hypothetical protein
MNGGGGPPRGEENGEFVGDVILKIRFATAREEALILPITNI